jgi:hypothetical protein
LVLASDVAVELLADCATEGLEHRVYFRGELVDTYRKIDTRLLLAHLARLDKATGDERAQADAARFDELLAVIGGLSVPEDLRADDDILLATPEVIACERAEELADAQQAEFDREDADGGDPPLDASDSDVREEQRAAALDQAYDRGLAEGLWQRADCHEDALAFVDYLLDEHDAETGPRTVSDVSTSALAAGLAAATHNPSPDESPRACPGGGASFERGVEIQDSTGPVTSPG